MSILDHNLYISDINAYIDPLKPVDKAIITHAHTDHARPNHNKVLATKDTINIMKIRFGENCAKIFQTLEYGQRIYENGIYLTLFPAGHILGSAQVLLEKNGKKVLVTGDFKTSKDNSCQAYEPVKADTLVTEATFGLPIFNHPDPNDEIKKLLNMVEQNNKYSYLIGAYSLGKAQRIIKLLRENKYNNNIYIHGSLEKISNYYCSQGISLGELTKINKDNKKLTNGNIIIAPPSSLRDRWSRGIPNIITGFASGWMHIKQRAKQRLVEIPIVISDHADWKELTENIKYSNASHVLITHGREEGLKRWCTINKIQASALSIKGRLEED